MVAGKDLTPLADARLISLTLTECRAGEADRLDLSLSDHDGKLEIPERNSEIQLALGWLGQTLVDKGTFTVDEAEHTGAPDQITLRARSASMVQNLRIRAEGSWHNTTLGQVVRDIATRNKLAVKVDADLASLPISHIDQTNESDVHFLTRLSTRFDAVATVKADTLLFRRINATRLEPVVITRVDGDQHRYHTSDREAYSGVRAYWYDLRTAKRRSVLVGSGNNLKGIAPSGTVAANDFHGAKRMKDTYSTERDALAAATAEWSRVQRGLATLELTLAYGCPDLRPQTPITVRGFKPQIDSEGWLVVKSTHSLGDGGYTTRVEMELGTVGAEVSSVE